MLRHLKGFALGVAASLTRRIALPSTTPTSSFSLSIIPSPQTGVYPRPTAKNLHNADDLAQRVIPVFDAVAANKDLIFYGAIASFGILMMGLAIGSASSSSKNNAAEQLTRLKQEKEKAENLAKLKAEFLNQVSHELRTPLAV